MSNAKHETTEKEMKDIWERLTAGEASIKSAHKRIDNLEKLSDSVNNLALATSEVAKETKLLREDYNKTDKELQELKEKPVKRYETIVTALLTAICSGVAGYLLALIL
jgi:predicted  nucleic acid-binding Zn-ribbon protein